MKSIKNLQGDHSIFIHKQFCYLLSSISVPQFIKDKIQNDAFNSHKFYLFLPFEISKIYPNSKHKKAEIMELTFYSYLYFASFLSFDKYYDEQSDNVGYKEYLKYYIFYIKEAALLGLVRLLGAKSEFWENFNPLKEQYFNSVYKSTKLNYNEIDIDIYKQIAKDKSIMSNAYVYALDSLLGSSKYSGQVLKALDIFHLGFQINDDYKDMREDLNNSQLNYFHWKICTNDKIELSEQNYRYYLKRAYLDGTVSLGLEESIKYLEKAKREIEKLSLINIEDTIDKLILNAKGEIHYISATVQKTKDRASKSNTRIIDNNLKGAVKAALNYLEQNLNNNVWIDFLTNAGYGKEWITGYVISMLGEIDNKMTFLESPLNRLVKKGGGYSSEIVKDADSTNFLIKALSIFNREITSDMIHSWFAFSNEKGGWATYYDDGIKISMRMPLDSDFIGWYTPQLCVTAVSAWVLKDVDNPITQQKYQSTLDFLERRQNSDGSWSSYWWTENIYATAYCIMAFPKTPQYSELLQGGIQYLVSKQSNNGAWLDNKETSVYYTSLSIKAIIDYYLHHKNENLIQVIRLGVNWLLQNQNIDGSWNVNRILRIPSPEIVNPDTIKQWGRTSFGLNCLVDDHNRLFTTSTAYNALSLYGNNFK